MQNKCSKCGGENVKGFLGLKRGVRWIADDELKGIYGWFVKPVSTNIVSFKCKSCGYLDNYVSEAK
ncbi:MAG: hypothetical protein U0525_05870 [Patescibacteria group bacterium]